MLLHNYTMQAERHERRKQNKIVRDGLFMHGE